MRILVTGSTGFIGAALTQYLGQQGHTVVRLVRKRHGFAEHEVLWNPQQGIIDSIGLAGCETIIHLCGENLLTGRWTKARKQRIYDSRVESTHFLCRCLSALSEQPKTLLTASAIAYYGNSGDTLLTEESPAGKGFLAKLCQDWEKPVAPLTLKGVRGVQLRFGVVLSPSGGGLKQMLPFYRKGLGGVLGDGRAYLSWISLHDTLAAIHHCIQNEAISGPVNIVGPEPVTNQSFTQTLGAVLKRPTIFPIPSWLLQLRYGEMARELLLSSNRVLPKKLEESGFNFSHPDLHETLNHLLHPESTQ